jgi:molybdopterin/thiamine biosynthesis adenylyltransferase
VPHSAAMTTTLHEQLIGHLRRADGQEDLCFATYRDSHGAARTTAVLTEVILPRAGERHVHGNVAFESDYFMRAADLAAHSDCGLALLHSHPYGTSWQDMSPDDVAAEHGYAGRSLTLTDRPLLGLTLATGDQSWSARSWPRIGNAHRRTDCETVRVVGDALKISYHPRTPNTASSDERLSRTISVWGPDAQTALARLRIGVVGLGSVGSMVAEALARSGVGHLVLIDFDSIKQHNLDRVLYATERDVALAYSKIHVAQRGLKRSATNPNLRLDALDLSVTEPDGWAAALDCDVLFSCVDRPWPRHLLNLAAYAHLIPVIDGGIRATSDASGHMLAADWKAHAVAPGRRCLQCLRQYDPAAVTMEREGLLDDPSYIDRLPAGHALRARENVFAFSMSTASLEVLQLVSMVVAPQGIADLGGQIYHAVTGELDNDTRHCSHNCPYQHELLAAASSAPALTGQCANAEHERAMRLQAGRTCRVRVGRARSRLAEIIGGM